MAININPTREIKGLILDTHTGKNASEAEIHQYYVQIL